MSRGVASGTTAAAIPTAAAAAISAAAATAISAATAAAIPAATATAISAAVSGSESVSGRSARASSWGSRAFTPAGWTGPARTSGAVAFAP